ncbi:meiosis-specific nuclear structural 1 [Trypanosoma rangeli]|uniref:Meiosis-specific nuclear structural protein 1 n=1 Tax=Trypanosoma rangeli TaxID=5698 RepID=A0A422P0U0_TRYRA|nr:meiosis-specific nuclear structural 1 [Trypanosoma rangeli]RNF11327.1 meiosis-specific nuclear structural 1 [Trypanosoma rangeli]|eukprot:RNF11327.1 meiosis-specific nuclear structural 1 [Trypanosoma rangeli]
MDANNARVERLRRVNRYKAVQAELALLREEEEFKARRERKLNAAARDEALAKQLAEEQRLDLLDAKMLQLVRTFPELQNLERQLKHALTKQGRKDQVEEIRQLREQQLQEEKDYIAQLNEQNKLEKAKEEERRKREIEVFRRHQAAQMDLIEERQAVAKREAEERRKERIAVDAVVARVHEKDFLEALERREKQRKLQAEHDEFYRLREELKEAERQRELREEEAINAYIAEQGRRKETDAKLAREREATKSRILEEQSKKIAEEQAKRDELESLLNDYYEAERLIKERKAMKDEKEARERFAEAVKEENWKLIQAHQKEKEAERAEEIRLRQLMMEDLARKAKLDRLSRERQMQLKREHILEAEKMLEARRELKREEERQAALVEEHEKKREEELLEYIRRARAQLLADYLPRLGEFVPAHVLTVDEKKQYGITK